MNTLSFTLPSFAKINWSLRILGKRPDGYHEVRTVMQTISLCDQLTFERTADGSVELSCSDSKLSTGEDNLVMRAAMSLKTAAAINAGCRVHLEKRIPTKAGLGGGSSNAAITLLGLVRLWELQLTSEQIQRLAAQIGADVPFFLNGGAGLATGTGTTVSLLPDGRFAHLIVVTPNASISTATAYEAFDHASLTLDLPKTILAVSHDESRFDDSDLWGLENDFERVIFDIEPEIKRARDALLTAGAPRVLLAGSGSSVFGIFDDLDAQVSASGMIEAEAGWRVFPCVTISRTDYSRAVNAGEQRSF